MKTRLFTSVAVASVLLGACATPPAQGTLPDGPVQDHLAMDQAALAALARENPAKDQDSHNPLFTQRYSADPTALYWQGRVYVYSTGDLQESDASGKLINNTYSKVRSLNVISSDDLVNWTDHGSILVAGDEGAASWAGNSWAPAIASKKIAGKDRFFLYFANSANGIGVLAADSPLGPFVDPLEEPLVSRMTENCRDVTWLFDPAVHVEADGRAWLYFGGGIPNGKDANPKTARVVQLGDDMASLAGVPQMIDAPWLFEDAGINKVGNKYIFTYCSNWSAREVDDEAGVPGKAEIIAMVGDSPMGPFAYRGSILRNPGSYFGGWGNNHHAIIQIGQDWYVFYHSFVLQDALKRTGGYRSVHADRVNVDADGYFEPIEASREGLEQIRKFNPYQTVPAGTMAWWGGRFEVDCSRQVPLGAGDWTGLAGVDFGSQGSSLVTVRVAAAAAGSTLAVCVDSLAAGEGTCLGGIAVPPVPAGQDYVDVTARLDKVSGVHDLFFLCAAGELSLVSWQFVAGR